MAFQSSALLRKFFMGCLSVLVVWTCTSGATAAQVKGKIDEKAIQILTNMSDYLSQAKTMSFKAEIAFDQSLASGPKARSNRTSVFLLRRPKELRVLSIAADGAARTAWFDGSRLTIFFRAKRQYTSIELKGGTDALLDRLIGKYELELPLAHLLLSDLSAKVKTSLISAAYMGEVLIDGVNCHHVMFESKDAQWEMWIEAGITPLPRRFDRMLLNQKGKAQFSAKLNTWKINPPTGPKDFTPEIPYQTDKIPFSPELIGPKTSR